MNFLKFKEVSGYYEVSLSYAEIDLLCELFKGDIICAECDNRKYVLIILTMLKLVSSFPFSGKTVYTLTEIGKSIFENDKFIKILNRKNNIEILLNN